MIIAKLGKGTFLWTGFRVTVNHEQCSDSMQFCGKKELKRWANALAKAVKFYETSPEKKDEDRND